MRVVAIVLMSVGIGGIAQGGERPVLVMNEDALHYPAYTAASLPERTAGKVNELTGLSSKRLPPECTLTKEGVERYIDSATKGRLTHFFINVNYQRAFYPSKVIEPVWASLDEPEREHRDYIRDLRDAFARGLDIYAVMFARCRARDVSPWLSFRMNDIHGVQVKESPMYSTFWKDHPEWHVGDDNGWANGLDHAQEPVRARMLAFIREALDRYDADGVEMDLIRFPYYFRKGTEQANAPAFTDYVRRIRALCDAAAKRRGHPVKLAARLLPTPAEAVRMGMAADVWAREGLVDAIVVCNMYDGLNADPPLAEWRTWTGGKVKILAGTDSGWSTPKGRRLATTDEYRTWGDEMTVRGADGHYLFNFFEQTTTGTAWKAVLEDGLFASSGSGVVREIGAKLGPCRVTQEGGRTVVELENRAYHVAKGASTKRDFWISNHTEDLTHPIGLDLRGATNLTIRGNGATVVFHDACVGVAIEDAANVKLENLKLTWSRPIVTEGEIVRFGKGETTVRIDPGLFPYRIEKDALFAVGDGWEYPAALAMTFSGRTHEIVETTTDFIVKGAARANADGTVTFAQDFSAGGKVKPGDILILRPRSRPYPAVFVYHAKDTLLEDVAIHTAWGMGLVAQMSENVTWRGTRTALDRTNGCFPPEGSKQVVTLHADASHFSNVKGAVTVENGLFETMLDDAVNVHSTCLGIVKVLDPKTIRCRYMHRQATGFGVFNPGDRLRFIRGKTLENDAETTVVAVAAHGHEEVTLTLRDALPGGIAAGDAVENADYQPSVVCRGNVVRLNRARGVLFTTPKPVVCESNVFDHVSGAAILFAGDAQGWYESGACEDVLVRGNVFTDCLTSPGFQFCDGIIASWPTIREPKAQKRHYHRNIRIEDNVFNTFDVPLLYARSTDGLVFRGNVVCTNAHYAGWGKGAFDVKDCDNAVLVEPARVKSVLSAP